MSDFPDFEKSQAALTAIGLEKLDRATAAIIMSQWRFFAALVDVSDLEAEGVMVEAVIPIILFGLRRACKRHGISFDLVLNDSIELEKSAARRKKQRVN